VGMECGVRTVQHTDAERGSEHRGWNCKRCHTRPSRSIYSARCHARLGMGCPRRNRSISACIGASHPHPVCASCHGCASTEPRRSRTEQGRRRSDRSIMRRVTHDRATSHIHGGVSIAPLALPCACIRTSPRCDASGRPAAAHAAVHVRGLSAQRR
jgi:hypothetical protein